MNIFASLDPAVKKLLGWKMGDEEEKWALKAVESLVKKMQKRKNHGFGTVEDLEYALAHPGSNSNCVTIPRSLDGRLQVSHRKGLPHVIYCRVWRWPNLQSHQELRPMPNCAFPYDGRSEQICINPYHYQRIELAGQSSAQHRMSERCEKTPFQQKQPSISPFSSSSSSPIPKMSLSPLMSHPSTLCPSSSLTPISSSSSSSSSTSSLIQSTANFVSQQLRQQQSPDVSEQPSFPFSQSPSSALSDDDDFVTNHHQNPQKLVPQPTFWCSICYYELNSRVGEPFKVSVGEVAIDGFTNPSSEGRICLGLLSNVNRNATIENTRRHIGMGIRLSCTENGVLLLNQSDAAVFVQSRNANFKYSLQPTAVCRVPPGATMLIFDYMLFGGMLEKAKADGYQHVYEIVKMCFVRLSFVKGWGADYQRQDVTSTPCWLELQLHQPMAWIDCALEQLDPPDHNGITSVS